MPESDYDPRSALVLALNNQREHILGALDGLSDEQLRQTALPTGWTPLGLVKHLTLDVEQFWFRRVMAGETISTQDGDSWTVNADVPAEAVLAAYRAEIKRADAIIAATPLDTVPAWWPDFFGDFRLKDLTAVVLHVITETACHAGHLDAFRELTDGQTWLILS
jgi:uncharacterized damage-inducible protein DinB